MVSSGPSGLELAGTLLFFCAVIHTFLTSKFHRIANSKTKDSLQANLWHLLSEVEVVFGLWALLFVVFSLFLTDLKETLHYLDSINYTEPLFIFVIMCIAGNRPIITLAEKMISGVARLLPFSSRMSFYLSALIVGPLLGSFITEPAAMTITALILLEHFYRESVSLKFKYATLALLFVNVSIGGTLTHFAAPPVLMVAAKWQWDTLFMLEHFGYKSFIAILFSTGLYAFWFKKELSGVLKMKRKREGEEDLPAAGWNMAIHALFLFLVVFLSHHPKVFLGIFCFFLGFIEVTRRDNSSPLKWQTSFLVAFFLGGLVTLGPLQAWWLQDLLKDRSAWSLFLGATGLTAITDNAALTYLGSLVPLEKASQYALVAGAVAGGGLTVIANAPNPAGLGILKETFGGHTIDLKKLFFYALVPTLIGMLCLFFLPSVNL